MIEEMGRAVGKPKTWKPDEREGGGERSPAGAR
jgi:hypothetical protein